MQEKIDNKISSTIMACRFPLALFVVFIHSKGDTNASFWELRHFLSLDFLSFVVPTFFIFSGYLFSWNIDDNDTDWYKSKLAKRTKTLLIPYIVWNTITLLLDYIKFLNGSESWIDYPNKNIWEIAEMTFINHEPLNLPLWYIRDLIILIVASPIFVRLIKRYPIPTLGIIGVWYFSGFGIFIVSPVSLLFFSIGVCLGMRHLSLLLRKYYSWTVMGGALLSLAIYEITDIHLAFDCYRLFMPFAFMFIISVVIEHSETVKQTLMKLSKYSRIIYYSHFPITLILSIKIISWILPIYTMVNYIVIPILAALISIILQVLLEKISEAKIISRKL